MGQAAQAVYRQLRAAIIGGEIPAAAKLGETELASRYDVSRTPIREALRRLQAEGLVEIEPNRGARVVDWSDLDVEGIYELRSVVESLIARRATNLITPEQIRHLRAICDDIDRIADVADADQTAEGDAIEAIADLNSQLHGLVADVAGGYHIRAVRNTIVVVPLVLRMISGYQHEDQVRSNLHHRELLRAFEARDPDWASSVMVSHVLAAKSILLRDIDEAEPSADADGEVADEDDEALEESNA